MKILVLALLLTPLACENPFSAQDEIEIIVLESLTECLTFALTTYSCMQVIQLPGTEPGPLYGSIEGFGFEPGVRQRLLVARYTIKEPPLDASQYEYRLIRVISRKRIFWVMYDPAPVSARSGDCSTTPRATTNCPP